VPSFEPLCALSPPRGFLEAEEEEEEEERTKDGFRKQWVRSHFLQQQQHHKTESTRLDRALLTPSHSETFLRTPTLLKFLCMFAIGGWRGIKPPGGSTTAPKTKSDDEKLKRSHSSASNFFSSLLFSSLLPACRRRSPPIHTGGSNEHANNLIEELLHDNNRSRQRKKEKKKVSSPSGLSFGRSKCFPNFPLMNSYHSLNELLLISPQHALKEGGE